MIILKNKLLCTLLVGAVSINLHAVEQLDLIKIESSTIDINSNKKTEVSFTTTIDKKRIEEVNINNMNDVLRAIPGATVSSRTGEMSQIHLRGLGQQQFMGENSGVAIIVDGVPVMQQSGGVRINLKDIENIKVIKGSASYLYGDTALSGAVVITTKKAKGKNSIDLEATLGSSKYQDYLLSINKSTDNFLVNLNTSYRKTDGYWVDSENWTKSVNGKVTYFLDDSSDVSFSADITNKYDEAGSRSVTAGISEAMTNPKGSGDSYTKDNNIDLDKFILSYNKEFDNESNLTISTYQYKDFYKYKSNPQNFIYAQEIEKNLKQYGLKTEYVIDNNSFATMFGLELGKKELDNKTNTVLDYSEYDRRKKANVDYYNGENELIKDEESISAIYSELKYSITPKLTTTLNARYDYQKKEYSSVENDFDGTSWSTNRSSDTDTFENMSYRFGTTYEINDKSTVFTSISTAFQTPDVEDLNDNPKLEEQKSINYELGLRGNTFNKYLSYEASIYELKNKDIIGPEGGTYSFGDPIDNAGDTRSRGFELALHSDKNETFSFDFAYTYLNAEYTKYNPFIHTYQDRSTETFNIVGNSIPRTSKHTIDLFLNFKATNKLTLISEIYAKSSYYADETNIVKMPGYGILNLQARYNTKFNKNKVEFFAKVDNLFDKQFYRSAYLHRDKRGALGIDKEDLSIVVDPGRVFYAGIKYSF
jgi:iron complex outermembrane receptor protein